MLLGRQRAEVTRRWLLRRASRTCALFDELWESATLGHHESARKTIDHPHVSALTLDCDILTVVGNDLRIMIYTGEPGTQDAERLALLSVIGTQSLAG